MIGLIYYFFVSKLTNNTKIIISILPLFYLIIYPLLPDLTLGCHYCVKCNETMEIENISFIEDFKTIIEYDLMGKKVILKSDLDIKCNDMCFYNCQIYMHFGMFIFCVSFGYLIDYLLSVGEFSKYPLKFRQEHSYYNLTAFATVLCLILTFDPIKFTIFYGSTLIIYIFLSLIEYNYKTIKEISNKISIYLQ